MSTLYTSKESEWLGFICEGCSNMLVQIMLKTIF